MTVNNDAHPFSLPSLCRDMTKSIPKGCFRVLHHVLHMQTIHFYITSLNLENIKSLTHTNRHPIVFTSLLYFHSLPQSLYPRPLFPYPECFLLPKRNGWRNVTETRGPYYLTGSDQFSSFCCAKSFSIILIGMDLS